MQADVLSSITPKALAPLAGDPAGPAAFLLIRLAFLVALVAGFPLLMGPFRQARADCNAACRSSCTTADLSGLLACMPSRSGSHARLCRLLRRCVFADPSLPPLLQGRAVACVVLAAAAAGRRPATGYCAGPGRRAVGQPASLLAVAAAQVGGRRCWQVAAYLFLLPLVA